VVPLAALMVSAEERQLMNRAVKRLDKYIAVWSKVRNDRRCVGRAPADVVQGERDKLAAYEAKRAKLVAGLERL